VPSLEGAVRIRLPAGTRAGQRLRLPGKGLRGEGGSRGSLYAVVRIDLPDRTDPAAEPLWRELKERAR